MVAHAAGIRTRVVKMPLTLARIYGYLWEKNARRTGTQPTVTHREVAYSNKWLFYDVSKAQRELGLELTPVEVSLGRAVEWFKREGYIPRSDPWVWFTKALQKVCSMGMK